MKQPLFSCAQCDMKFSIRADRDKHVYTHQNVKNFKCKDCSEEFKQIAGLLNHKKVHQAPNLRCQRCDQIFSTKSNLTAHQITHEDRAKFLCEKCNKLFKRAPDLKMHQKKPNDKFITKVRVFVLT